MLRRPVYWLTIVFLILPAIALGQEMNECSSEDGSAITKYNATQLSTIFEDIECKNGLIEIKHSGRSLCSIYGNIETREGSTGLVITSGGILAEGERNANITGPILNVNAETPGRLRISTTTGIYTQNKYSFLCREGCELVSAITMDKSSLIVYGDAVIVKTEYMDEYKNKQEFDRRWIANISNMNEIIVSNAEDINFSALAIKGEFDRTKIESEEFISIRRIGENVHDLITAYGTANITFSEGKNVGAYTANNNPFRISVIGPSVAFMVFILKDGKVFVLGSKEEFDLCAGKTRSEESGLFEESGCIFTNSRIGEEIVQIAPDKPGAKVVMDVSYPLLRVFQNLKIEPFWGQATESLLGIIRARSDSRMEFSKENITLKSGNWFDFDTSFSAWVYEPDIQQYSNLVCNIETRQCFFNGTQVYGFEGVRANICRRDRDCGEGMRCTCITGNRCQQKRCVRQASCREVEDINSANPQERQLKILFISDGYDDESEFINDIKKVVDKDHSSGFNGLLSISPFNEDSFKNSVVFYSMNGGYISFSGYGTNLVPNAYFTDALQRQCSEADMAIVLSKKDFEHYSSRDGNIYISMPKLGTGLILLHEFAHSFGSLNDEFIFASIGSPRTGIPNCLLDNTEARNIWSSLVGEERTNEIIAENNRGCGGYCTGSCAEYIKPSRSSIMSKEYSHIEGKSFNDVSEEWLRNRASIRIRREFTNLKPRIADAIASIGGKEADTEGIGVPKNCGDWLARVYKWSGYAYIYNDPAGRQYRSLQELASKHGYPIGYNDDRLPAHHALMLLGFGPEMNWWLEQFPDIPVAGDEARNVNENQALTISYYGPEVRFDIYPKESYPHRIIRVHPWTPLCEGEYLPATTDAAKYGTTYNGQSYWSNDGDGNEGVNPWSRYWEPESPYYPTGGDCSSLRFIFNNA